MSANGTIINSLITTRLDDLLIFCSIVGWNDFKFVSLFLEAISALIKFHFKRV